MSRLHSSLPVTAALLLCCASDPPEAPGGGQVTLTPAGGRFEVGGVVFDVPSGAVSDEVSVQLEVRAAPPSAPDEGRPITAHLRATPHGTRFAVPVTITLPLVGSAPETPEVWFLADDDDRTWERLAPARLVANGVSFETEHFSWMLGLDVGARVFRDASVRADAAPRDAEVPDAAVDAGFMDAGPDAGVPESRVPVCHVYGVGGPDGEHPAIGITYAAGRLYWSTYRGAIANQVHTIRTDLNDYRRYTNQTNVAGFAGNQNGVFWASRAFDPSAGLYREAPMATNPSFVEPIDGLGGLMAADSNQLIYRVLSQSGASFQRAAADGAGGAPWFYHPVADQLQIANGHLYWLETSISANVNFCTPGAVLPMIQRVPLQSAPPTEYQVVMEGCAALATSDFPDESVIRFTTDGTFAYATSNSGNVFRVSVNGGSVTRLYQSISGTRGLGIVIVGRDLVWIASGSNVPGLAGGFRKMPLEGGPSVVFAPPYNQIDLATDGSRVYFATHQHVCALEVQ